VTKETAPLFGLKAAGTLGNQVTFQERAGTPFVRVKPTPGQPHTLAQTYQRWLYRDYLDLWNTLDEAAQEAYRRKATRRHIAPMSQFLSEKLVKRDDLALWLRLDETGGAVAQDSGGYGNDGERVDVEAVPGVIDGGASFNGTSSYIRVPDSPFLPLGTEPATFMASFRYEAGEDHLLLLKTDPGLTRAWYSYTTSGGQFRFDIKSPGKELLTTTTQDYGDNQWHHFAALRDGATLTLIVDGEEDSTPIRTELADASNPGDLYLSAYPPYSLFSHLGLDNLAVYNRLLTPEEVRTHARRHYP